MHTITKTVYVANDGAEFLSEEECRDHDREIEVRLLAERIERDCIYSDEDEVPDAHDIAAWIIRNISLLNRIARNIGDLDA